MSLRRKKLRKVQLSELLHQRLSLVELNERVRAGSFSLLLPLA
jgi:hypothetical protein